ncbi:MAG: hypothetical protein QF652_05000 [Dehalococcoidia bacterium]|nr:hypothetical protein [Dehalococcoidia bacterium]
MTTVLPAISSLIMFAFVALVFERWVRSRRPALLFWGVGLTMFGIASFAEVYSSFAWNDFVFRSWYAVGPLLNAAWIGLGTVYLLSRPRFAHSLFAILGVGSLIGLYGVMTLPIDGSGFVTSLPLSDQYQQILPDGAWVRLMTPLFNIFGLIALVGGAIYSAFLFWRKKTLLNRMWGNVLIATGALVIAFASTLTRFGIGDYLYVGELVSAALMFSGFLVATHRAPEGVSTRNPTPAGAPTGGSE